MSALSSLFKLFTARQSVRKPHVALSCISGHLRRHYADNSKQDVNSKHVVVSSINISHVTNKGYPIICKNSVLGYRVYKFENLVLLKKRFENLFLYTALLAQGTENEERVRVRRARPADVPRVLRFVREHAKAAWPGLVAPPSASHLVLCDYVARALAQGHSMLAEQQETRRGWSQIRGLALGMSVCPWDATMLERWARCVRCTRSRRLMHFTAHCLRAPALHDKYRVHNILQVILIVPQDSPKNAEIVHVLAKNAIQRGRDVGFPVLRFDVTDDAVAKALEELKLKKEWQLTYDVLPDSLKERQTTEPLQTETNDAETPGTPERNGNFIAVYTAFTDNNVEK